jgi:hypothetical protein
MTCASRKPAIASASARRRDAHVVSVGRHPLEHLAVARRDVDDLREAEMERALRRLVHAHHVADLAADHAEVPRERHPRPRRRIGVQRDLVLRVDGRDEPVDRLHDDLRRRDLQARLVDGEDELTSDTRQSQRRNLPALIERDEIRAGLRMRDDIGRNDIAPLAVDEHFELLGTERGDGEALPVDDLHVDPHEIDARAKDGALLARLGGERRRSGDRTHQHDPPARGSADAEAGHGLEHRS